MDRHQRGSGDRPSSAEAADDDRARAEYVKAYDRANRSAASYRDQRNQLAIELGKLTDRTWRQVLDDAGMNDVPDADAGQAALLDIDQAADLAPAAGDGDEPDVDEDPDWRGTGS